ncbi:MAG: peptidyl-prolyl cis-trans isomerase [Phycisphaerae bacterium]|nr:peptidyl-prolyl cis-trans isomerase [Phycisphaerae bacterium]
MILNPLSLTLAAAVSFALASQPAEPGKPAPTPPATPPAKEPAKVEKPAQPEPPKKPQEASIVQVKISTSMGDIVAELDAEKAPISTANFLSYVDKKFYDGTIFHRVIDNFMIQGGGFDKDMNQKATDKPIKNEWKNGLKNKRGTLAMARTNVADSATSQFFINVKDNDFLDQSRDGAAYAVFGRVVSGMDVVDKIRGVKTTMKKGQGDVPVENVVINSITRVAAAAPPAKN